MFDASMRKLIDPPLNFVGRHIAVLGVSANTVTVAGFVIGMSAVPLLAFEHYLGALVAIAANRITDGLDGAIARSVGPTAFGGYLDIVCDFIFYSAVIFGFALARPEENGVAAAFLILSFVGTGSSFLAYAILAAKTGKTTEVRGSKSFFHLGGLTEGTETIAFLAAITLLPDWFVVLAFVFGALAWITTASRVAMTWRSFGASL
ncbi:MAG: CDP-alcohol phosphatidyltransferase family protein [Alphaproteobacteria bacterium]